MKEERMTRFAEFWPFYMSQHTNRHCRALHYVGTCLSTALMIRGWAGGNGLLFLAAIPAGYGPAWIGHFLFERNRPATFQHPFYSLLADYVMVFRFLTGRLGPHIPIQKS